MTRKLEQSIAHLRTLKGSLSALKPQVHEAINAMSLERDKIEQKTLIFNNRFRHSILEYHQARAKIEELEMAAEHRDENVNVLNGQLELLTLELADVKKQIHDKGKSITDTAPVIQMRAAIERLKEENREFDILIGVLYHEVTKARKGEGSYKQSEDEESDEDITY